MNAHDRSRTEPDSEPTLADETTQTQATQAEAAPRLQRVLTLWDLILYGIVLIMPIAPVPLFGLAQKMSGGHAVTTSSSPWWR